MAERKPSGHAGAQFRRPASPDANGEGRRAWLSQRRHRDDSGGRHRGGGRRADRDGRSGPAVHDRHSRRRRDRHDSGRCPPTAVVVEAAKKADGGDCREDGSADRMKD